MWDTFWLFLALILVVGVLFWAFHEAPKEKQRRIERQASEDKQRAARAAKHKALVEQSKKSRARKRQRRKETLGKAAASPFAAAGIAAGVTKAAYEHTKQHLGPDSTATFCPRCGNEMKTEDRFCSRCGQPIVEGD